MAKKRGKLRLNGVGTKTEQHAERVLRLATLNSPNADPLAYESLLYVERRDPEKFKTVMIEPAVAALYARFDAQRKAREQALLEDYAAREEQQAAERVAAKAERKRRKLALNGEGTLTEQHINRVKRLWSVLRERNHNMYQYRTRVAFAESMKWLEENETNTFLNLLESLDDMPNGDDAYFIFVRHELNQAQKQVAAAHEKVDLDILAPTGRRKSAETHLKKQMIDKALAISEDDITEVDEIDPDWMTLSDLSEGKL